MIRFFTLLWLWVALAVSAAGAASSILMFGGHRITAVPSNLTLPVIWPSSPVVGTAEFATHGTWTQYPTSYAYQWEYFDTTTNIGGATSASYTPVSGDIGHTLAIKIIATNAKGSSAQAISAATSAVVAAAACAYGLNFAQGCNVAILAQGQLQ